MIEVVVDGASDENEAIVVAKSIAGSMLVKSAVFGHDPNWGRIACAAGYSGVLIFEYVLHFVLQNTIDQHTRHSMCCRC